MKIAMYNVTTTMKAGGIETFVWEVSKVLSSQGHQVDIIGGRGNVPYQETENLRVFSYPFIPRRYIPNLGSRFKKIGERISFAIFAIWRLLFTDYDVIHIYKPYDFPIAWFIKKIKKNIICYGSHGTDFIPGDRLFIRYIDLVFACSSFNALQIKRRFSLQPIILYNGFNQEQFKPSPLSKALKDRLRIPNDRKVILAVNRLIGWKGTHHLIDACIIVKKKIDLTLIIVGEGDEKKRLMNKVKEAGLDNDILFTGFVPNKQIAEYFSIADLYLLASVSDETFGITLCEAMACEVPVIATRVGGIPEVVEDGKSGFLVEPRSPQALAEKITVLLNDLPLRKKIGKMGRERVLTHFTWEKIVNDLLACYKKAAVYSNHD